MIRIACVGDNCVDFYDNTNEAFPGGNPVNVAVYIRRLGGSSSYIGPVGTDDHAVTICEALEKKGVDISHVQTISGNTAITHVSRIDGERVFGDYEEGVMAKFSLRQKDIDFICTHDLVVSAHWGHAEQYLPKFHERGIPVAFDCAEYPLEGPSLAALPYTDIAFFSNDTASEEDIYKIMGMVSEMGPALTICTRGDKGSICYDGKDFYHFGIVPCEIVDTLGAGDSYIAGFLLSWLQNKTVPACMEAGAFNAATTLSYCGAW